MSKRGKRGGWMEPKDGYLMVTLEGGFHLSEAGDIGAGVLLLLKVRY